MSNKATGFIKRMLYKNILRPLILKAIDDPDEIWDDWVLNILDGIFLDKGNEDNG